MSETNGKTDTLVAVTDKPAPEPYRPKASTEKVYDAIHRGLSSIAHDAALEACEFLSLASHYDKDKGTAVRYGHLVDAAECLEIAMTHLGQLKSAMSYRLRIEDDQNPDPFQF